MDRNKQIAERIRKEYGGDATQLSMDTIDSLANELGVSREMVSAVEIQLTFSVGDGTRRVRSEYRMLDPPAVSAIN